jgi:phage baseplate assembly protein W
MEQYKGISFPFRFNSRGGVQTSTLTPYDFSRIRESITQIVMTAKKERVMLNDFGTNAENSVFENLDDATEAGILRHEIMKAIEEQEDRVAVNECSILTEEEDGVPYVLVVLDIHIIKFMRDETMTVRFAS